jgi:hypothetical protein
MTKEIKKLFAAPWELRPCDVGYDVISAYNSIAEDRIFVAHADSKSAANRLARLPELYDALIKNTYERCANVRASLRCYPLTIEEFIRGACDCDTKCAWGYCKTWELLRKVRDGE